MATPQTYWWSTLSERERTMGAIAGFLVVLFLIWFFFFSGFVSWSRPATTVTKKEEVTQAVPPAAPAYPASAILPAPASVSSAPVPGVIKEEKETVFTSSSAAMCVSEQRMKELLAEACKAPSQTARSTVSKPRTVSKAPRRDTGGLSATATAAASGGHATATASGGGASATASVNAPSAPAAVATPAQPSTPISEAPPPGKFWGWIHPEATPSNKRTCFADRLIQGIPTQCSSVEVFPRQGSETEVEWNARVAAKNGLVVGRKTEKGVISNLEFRRVEVK